MARPLSRRAFLGGSLALGATSLLAACGGTPRPAAKPPAPAAHPTPHQAQVTAVIQPMIDAEIASAMVVGLYDRGKTEVYGFGKGPGGGPPTATTLFELGSVTKVYTSLLFADAIQRREVGLEQPVSELLPTGVSVPTRDGVAITLKHLALHSSGLPRIRFHDLRHTHATLLLKAGVPIKVVSERLGHSTPGFTMATYQHVIPGMQEEAALTFASLLDGGPGQPASTR